MDYEKAYKAVLQTARQWIKDGCTDKEKICLECVFPELRESEDEKVRKCLIAMVNATIWDSSNLASKKACLEWLEKQKGQKPDIELIQRSWYMEGYHDREFGKEPMWLITACDGGPIYEMNPNYGKKLAEEQKPNSTEDMPYVADEHFFEREPADSFKYRLAEYMTKNCKKGEGPYGYSYNISSESILQMAKEELIKRGELKEQKPAWSEEDIDMMVNERARKSGTTKTEIQFYRQGIEDTLKKL